MAVNLFLTLPYIFFYFSVSFGKDGMYCSLVFFSGFEYLMNKIPSFRRKDIAHFPTVNRRIQKSAVDFLSKNYHSCDGEQIEMG